MESSTWSLYTLLVVVCMLIRNVDKRSSSRLLVVALRFYATRHPCLLEFVRRSFCLRRFSYRSKEQRCPLWRVQLESTLRAGIIVSDVHAEFDLDRPECVELPLRKPAASP